MKMGCCFSTTKLPPPHRKPHRNYQTAPTKRDPPPPPPPPPAVVDQEESVKEVVLSETTTALEQVPQQEEEEKKNSDHNNKLLKPKEEKEAETRQLSEVSEPPCQCEVSETFSYASLSTATTVTEVRDDNDEALSKRTPPAVSRQKRPISGERRGRGSVAQAVERRRVGSRAAGGARRDVVGEVAARRSRSPATGRAGGVGRGGLGRSGSRVTGRGGGRPPAVESQCHESELGIESLKNPLVALECFIFV